MGGRGGYSGTAEYKAQEDFKRFSEPKTRADYILRLEVLAEVGMPGYRTTSSVSDWENYGKSRTYLKINAYRESDGKFHHSQDYGYFDNQSGEYVRGRAGTNRLDYEHQYNASGNRAITDDEIKKAIKSINAKKFGL